MAEKAGWTANINGNDVVSADDETEFAREHTRTELGGVASATIYPKEGEAGEPDRCTVLMRNVSLAGFGIALTRPIEPKQHVELDFGGKRFACEIAWCRKAEFGFYIAGCKLPISS